LFNNEFMLQQADWFAQRLRTETTSDDAAVDRAFRLAFGRSPDAAEMNAARQFLVAQRAAAKGHPDTALLHLCRVLLNSTEFVSAE
ncbi:MAG: DUF1553 domain-containing protein, partial [Planctomycetaceae bacterium]|nr:DUF1553 domain-containing protein [Planctomycetaceae bacterium]